MPPSKRHKRPSEKVPHDFVALLRSHLKTLGKNPSELATMTRSCPLGHLDNTQLSRWLNRDERFVTRHAVSILAMTLAVAYKGMTKELQAVPDDDEEYDDNNPSSPEWTKRYPGTVCLEPVLNGLLQSLGLSPAVGNRDLVWQRLAGDRDRTLKVGWYYFDPFAFGPSDKPPQGIAREITDRVAAILGVKVDWVHLSVEKITPALLYGQIDMICAQYIQVEPRLWDVWMSDPAPPSIRLRPAWIVHRDHVARLVGPKKAGAFRRARAPSSRYTVWLPNSATSELAQDLGMLDSEQFAQLAGECDIQASAHDGPEQRVRVSRALDQEIGELRTDQFKLVHTKTLVGQALADVSRPLRGVGGSELAEHKGLALSLNDIVKDVLTTPVDEDDGLVRVLVTDAMTALDARTRRFKDQAVELSLLRGEFDPVFAVGFALHPAESNTLGRLINRAIERLRVQGAFPALFQRWEPLLKEANALPSRLPSRIREKASDLRALIDEEYADPNRFRGRTL